MNFDTRELRNTLGMFASGVTVIAAALGEAIYAMTANAVSSVSLDPPLILFCPAKKSKLGASVGRVKSFSVNVLRGEQQPLASHFSGAWRDSVPPPFRFVHAQGTPRLEGSLASLVCQLEHVVEGGDHWVVLGRVLELYRGISPHRPLLFFQGQFRAMQPGEDVIAPELVNVAVEPPHIFYHSF